MPTEPSNTTIHYHNTYRNNAHYRTYSHYTSSTTYKCFIGQTHANSEVPQIRLAPYILDIGGVHPLAMQGEQTIYMYGIYIHSNIITGVYITYEYI